MRTFSAGTRALTRIQSQSSRPARASTYWENWLWISPCMKPAMVARTPHAPRLLPPPSRGPRTGAVDAGASGGGRAPPDRVGGRLATRESAMRFGFAPALLLAGVLGGPVAGDEPAPAHVRLVGGDAVLRGRAVDDDGK